MNIEIETKSKFIADLVVKSVVIDINTTSEYFERSNLRIESNNSIIQLKVDSTDIISARASINTCLKWVENSMKIIEYFYQ